jgi:Prp8 binding protein
MDSSNQHEEEQLPSKRPRTEQSVALYTPSAPTNNGDEENDNTIRTSSLSHPTMKLSGHKGSVYSLAYSPDGECLVSGSFDMTCLIWNASGACENFNILEKGHKNAILDVKWNCDSDFIVTASADKNLAWWDASTGSRIKRFQGHEGIVNAVDTLVSSPKLLVSSSDDKTARMWDARTKGHVSCFEHEFQCTSVAYGADGNMVYTGGIDNCITAWDVRTQSMSMKMKGHKDTITSLSLHPKGTHLLSNSMDGTLKTWDIQPFVADGGKRHCKTFQGGTHSAEKGLLNCAWSSDGTMVTGGSADKVVHVWDELSTEELYYLPGHSGCVNSVVFHPKENIVASGSSDKSIYVGELSA